VLWWRCEWEREQLCILRGGRYNEPVHVGSSGVWGGASVGGGVVVGGSRRFVSVWEIPVVVGTAEARGGRYNQPVHLGSSALAVHVVGYSQ
jgi:hypothetical protein